MGTLYDDDILLWSEQQAARLRRRAETANDPDLDWANLAEEIESVGRSELHTVESHLVQALAHMLKAEAWPEARDVPHWKAEARGHQDEARQSFTPSMRQRLDLADLYRRARNRVPETYDGAPPGPLPETCPATLEALLDTP